MKKITACILLLLLIVAAAGCGAAPEAPAEAEPKSPIAGRVYAVNTMTDELGWSWCKFYGDGTFQGVSSTWTSSVNGKPQYSRKSTYGTYALDGAALTMSVGEMTLSAVIMDGGQRIMIGDIELVDRTEKLVGDSIMDEFR